MMYSVADILRTRLCAAQNCDQDAEPNGSLCWRCVRKPLVVIHVEPEQYTGPTLQCCHCHEYKPDDAFCKKNRTDADRRGRHFECRECGSQRRRIARARMTPEQREAETTRARINRQKRRAEAAAKLGWPPA